MTTASNPFEPKRLKIARQFHGYTQVELGERIGVSRQFLNQLEAGVRSPSDEMYEVLAASLHVEREFFGKALEVELEPDECNFRSRESSRLRDLEQVIAHGTLLAELVRLLETELEFPAADFPHFKVDDLEGAERAAERVRLHWGLTADQPIDSTIRVAENAGAVVVKFPGVASEIDALSVCGKRPLIVRASEKENPTRLRFDVSHEIGHLVMHQNQSRPEHENAEAQANRFASAFLLPRKAFVREWPLGKRLDWHGIFALKRAWKVSAQAILRRALDLQLIDAAQYRGGNIFISKQGYKRNEPFEPTEIEAPELLKTALIELQKAEGLLPRDVAQRLGVQPVLLGKLLDIAIPDLRDADPRLVINLNARLDWSKAKWGNEVTKKKTKTNFQLVKFVLDQLHADVVAEHGKTSADKRIKAKLQELSAAYERLSDPKFPPIDYAPPETRLAYVYTHVATHADYVYQILNTIDKHLKKTLLKAEKAVITCLGGGPGSELVGLLQYLSEEDSAIKTLTVYLCDREQAWADCWTEIGEEVPGALHLNTNFQPLDVTNPDSWSKQKKFLSADLFVSSYFASEVARLGDKADAFWKELSAKAQSGAFMLILDNDHSYFSDYVTQKIITKSWDVVVSDTDVLTPSGREQKSDLEGHLVAYDRSPKLRGRIAYWLLKKK